MINLKVMELEHKYKVEDTQMEYKQVKDMTRIICFFFLCAIGMIIAGFGISTFVSIMVLIGALVVFSLISIGLTLEIAY